ncbi:hypothetical protein ENKNEFLB_02812 [Nocardioides aquaticus]|uniref:GPP34 family phosphoprotein n=1 Tax=Nocardioides aquaticus TaxID=160826 RepID=A0ABX8EMS4_9ACTN|nr:GPP34 family phosphoprotein [Nocardioides aquaticus]QVT80417.1 hypothetical protein ENKNEFLB_02812 [Nocardioides aquaticus]
MWEWLLKAFGVADEPLISPTPVPARMTPSLAHEALLICVHPVTGTLWDHTRHIWSAALLIELAHEGRLQVTGSGKATRHTLVGSSLLGDPELDMTLTRLELYRPGWKTVGQVDFLPGPEHLVERLVAEGLVVEEERVTGGLFKRRRLHLTAAGRDEPAARVRAALLGEAVPDERTALLVAALNVAMPTRLLVPKDRVKEADRRMREIVAGVGEAERALISAVRAARARSEGGGDGGGGD